ncbi:hypothetical protein Tco_0494615, partial [Tanacetum coccineum]
MELVLEQTQQGISNEVSVSTEGVKELKRKVKIKVEKKEALLTLRQRPGTRRANCVYTLDGQGVTKKTLKGRKQLGEYQTGWKIKTSNVLDFCNKRSTQQCISSMQVLQGVEFEVEPQKDHAFEVEPIWNVSQGAVAEAEKIYAHESLTFNNIVTCEVISKWKAGLKDDMDAWSDVYVLSNGCKKCSDGIDIYYWEYTPCNISQFQ